MDRYELLFLTATVLKAPRCEDDSSPSSSLLACSNKSDTAARGWIVAREISPPSFCRLDHDVGGALTGRRAPLPFPRLSGLART